MSYEKALTIGVNNLNEAPINLNLSATTINENVAVNTIIGNLSSTDPDTGNTFTYSLVSGTGSTDNASFSIINGNQLRINSSPDYETKNSYSVRVRTTDQGGLFFEKPLTISVNNLNDAPTLVNNAAIPVNQGSAVTITSALLQTTDQDNTAAQLTYTLTTLPSAGTLKLSGNTLAVGGKFTQDDINNSRVTYLQSGSSTTSDSFGFTVSDGAINPITTRISVGTGGTQSNGNSLSISISADGRYVTYESDASNLVSGDTNGNTDVFLYDRQTGTTSRISVDSVGTQANSDSFSPTISADGLYITYYSYASNLVSGDTNNGYDIFLYDRQNSTTSRISVDSAGNQGTRVPFNALAYNPTISADGRYVTYDSEDTNLVSGDTNAQSDIFVRDRQTNTKSRVSVNSSNIQGNGSSVNPSISDDGRYVTFSSSASNLVSGDTNAKSDIFVRDRQTNTTSRISVDSASVQGNNDSLNPSISADGRYVTYSSSASNLVSGDTNFAADIFVYDRQTNTTSRVSVNSAGVQGNGESLNPSISANGRYVTFSSSASNLVSGDTNFLTDIFVYDRQTNTTLTVR